MRRFALAALIMMASSTSVHAQFYERPKYTVGDTWHYTGGGVSTIIKVSEEGIVVTRSASRCPTCQWVFDKDGTLLRVLTEDGKPADTRSFGFLPIGMKLIQYPLEVNKKWRVEEYGLFRGDNLPYVIDCTVSALEDVKTKAGTFKAYRIDRSWKVKIHPPSPNWNDAIWIAPDVKALVKFDPGSRGPGAGATLPSPSFELESYKIAP
jgi:hypothetical protein